MDFHTPLRYPGGKARLGRWLAWLMRFNHISGGIYVEPYAGGAGLALYLLKNDYVRTAVINDIDPLVYNFWWSVIFKNEDFMSLFWETDVTLSNREKMLEIVRSYEEHDPVEVGFAAFFLNRVNRSGILGGGVIGGKNQSGKYQIDARYKKNNLAKRLEEIFFLRKRIKLFRQDAVKLVKDIDNEMPQKALIYMDPPYYIKGSSLYVNHYNPRDHEVVAECVKTLKTKWLVSYDDCPEIRSLYEKVPYEEFSFCYSTNKTRKKGQEIMFYGDVVPPCPPVMSRSPAPYPKSWDKII